MVTHDIRPESSLSLNREKQSRTEHSSTHQFADNRRESLILNQLAQRANLGSGNHQERKASAVQLKEVINSTRRQERQGAGNGPVVQRAIISGKIPVSRTSSIPMEMEDFLKKESLYDDFVRLNDDRETIYIFEDDQHVINYLKVLVSKMNPDGISAPLKHKITPQQLQEGHEAAQDIRFSNIYKPSTAQIPQNASGAHQIPLSMMPPSGEGHHWAQNPSPGSTGSQYIIYQNQLQPPPVNTLPLTFGDPKAPSLVMSQGGMNLGMHIQPTHNSAYLDPLTRSQTNYAGIPAESGRVRGHPFELKQNQISTQNPKVTFDNDRRTYTSESDSTKATGGISSWRYNQVEKLSTSSGNPFTQVNNNPVVGKMGIAQPDSIDFRMQKAPGSYTDLHMDNSGVVDYRNTDSVRPKGMRKQAYQTEMGKNSGKAHPYRETPVHKTGQDFTDPNRHSYPGYMTPPPTPFLSPDTLAEPEQVVILPGEVQRGSKVNMPDGSTGRVTQILDRDLAKNKARCKVQIDLATGWPTTFQ